MRCLVVVLIGAVALAGCADGPVKEISRIFERKGEPQLQAGIKNYDEGRLAQAQSNFESALSAGLNERDQVTAHKYLAFIHCVSKRERQCRAHFSERARARSRVRAAARRGRPSDVGTGLPLGRRRRR